MSSVLDFSVVGPALYVSLGALVVLLGELFLGRGDGEARRASVQLALVSAFALLAALGSAHSALTLGRSSVFNPEHPMLRLDPLAAYAIAVIALGALLSVALSILYLRELRIDDGEYYALLLIATAGMFVLVSAIDFITLFLGLEVASLPLYALAGFDRAKPRSNESGIKYFLLGMFASAVLLYGVAMLYGATGATSFSGVRAALDPESPLARIGVAFVLFGLAFKVAAVPFHQWLPDVYEGAPTSVTAFLSATVTVAAFVVLLRFVVEVVGDFAGLLSGVLWVVAALTMVIGNLMAAIQSNVKRLLAYSSIAHVGYVLVGLVTATPAGYAASLLYLLIHMLMSVGALGVVVALSRGGHECERLDDFAGLARRSPALAAAMALFVVSLLGIPGTAGFIAKFQVFQAAVGAGHLPLAAIGVAASLFSAYAYLRIPVAMYMEEGPKTALEEPSGSAERFVLITCTLAVLYLGALPGAAIDRAAAAAATLVP